MNTFRKKNSGFTLIELLIVILILGILAALFLPKLVAQPEKARAAEAIAMMGTIARAESAEFTQNGAYLRLNDQAATTAAWNTLGFAGNQGLGKYWSYAADAATGAVTATRNNLAATAIIIGTTLTLDQSGTWGGTHPNRPTN